MLYEIRIAEVIGDMTILYVLYCSCLMFDVPNDKMKHYAWNTDKELGYFGSVG